MKTISSVLFVLVFVLFSACEAHPNDEYIEGLVQDSPAPACGTDDDCEYFARCLPRPDIAFFTSGDVMGCWESCTIVKTTTGTYDTCQRFGDKGVHCNTVYSVCEGIPGYVPKSDDIDNGGGCTDEEPSDDGDECKFDSDCPSGQVCDDGECVTPSSSSDECKFDSDCEEGEHCDDGDCVADAADPDPDPINPSSALPKAVYLTVDLPDGYPQFVLWGYQWASSENTESPHYYSGETVELDPLDMCKWKDNGGSVALNGIMPNGVYDGGDEATISAEDDEGNSIPVVKDKSPYAKEPGKVMLKFSLPCP